MTRAFANGIWFTAAPAQQLIDFYGDEEVEETDECKGCAFRGAPASACKAAEIAAADAGLPACESRPDKCDPGHIYRRIKSSKTTNQAPQQENRKDEHRP